MIGCAKCGARGPRDLWNRRAPAYALCVRCGEPNAAPVHRIDHDERHNYEAAPALSTAGDQKIIQELESLRQTIGGYQFDTYLLSRRAYELDLLLYRAIGAIRRSSAFEAGGLVQTDDGFLLPVKEFGWMIRTRTRSGALVVHRSSDGGDIWPDVQRARRYFDELKDEGKQLLTLFAWNGADAPVEQSRGPDAT